MGRPRRHCTSVRCDGHRASWRLPYVRRGLIRKMKCNLGQGVTASEFAHTAVRYPTEARNLYSSHPKTLLLLLYF
jgi:hypothetical protein